MSFYTSYIRTEVGENCDLCVLTELYGIAVIRQQMMKTTFWSL